MRSTSAVSRRNFLRSMAATAVTPYVFTAASSRAQDANSELTIAAIGVGGSRGQYARGAYVGLAASKLGRMVACCDVDALHMDEFNQKFDGKLKTYTDYRKLLENENVDIVTIGTPDHWHTAIAIDAMRNGCDVYCEKPLTLTIDEGKQIRQVVEETGRVFQVGTQQRSEYDNMFLQTVALARLGHLGDNIHASVGIGGGPAEGPFETSAPPSDLDWNMWLGQAPKVEYTEHRCHANFRWWLEYSGGKMTDWGAHNIDIAQWAMGVQDTGPVKIEGTGEFPSYIPADFDPHEFFNGNLQLPNGYNTATDFDITFTFANGSTLNVRPEAKGDNGNGVLLEGDKGRIFVNRGKLVGKPVEDLTQAQRERLEEEVIAIYNGKQPGDHMRNFFECVEDRTQPISDVWTHQRTMTTCHLCNIVLLLGRPLQWDPQAEQFVNDEQANRLLSRPQRKGFEIRA